MTDFPNPVGADIQSVVSELTPSNQALNFEQSSNSQKGELDRWELRLRCRSCSIGDVDEDSHRVKRSSDPYPALKFSRLSSSILPPIPNPFGMSGSPSRPPLTLLRRKTLSRISFKLFNSISFCRLQTVDWNVAIHPLVFARTSCKSFDLLKVA
jgi:hypothetical protein